jgi:hypothetical protein
MRPIPAPRLGDAHGLLRAISERERLRLDEFVTEFTVEALFPPRLENALGRTRQFVSFARAARRRWPIVDELDRALGDLSSFLAGVPITLPDGESEPPDDWRVGAGAFLAAARFAAERNRAAPADERTLAHEALTAHVAPVLPELDDDGRRRLAALAG